MRKPNLHVVRYPSDESQPFRYWAIEGYRENGKRRRLFFATKEAAEGKLVELTADLEDQAVLSRLKKHKEVERARKLLESLESDPNGDSLDSLRARIKQRKEELESLQEEHDAVMTKAGEIYDERIKWETELRKEAAKKGRRILEALEAKTQKQPTEIEALKLPGNGQFAVNTSATGAISELLVCADLYRHGYEVFRALCMCCSCDLVVLKYGKLLRVEVKTGGLNENGKRSTLPLPDSSKYDLLCVVYPDGIYYETRQETEARRKRDRESEEALAANIVPMAKGA